MITPVTLLLEGDLIDLGDRAKIVREVNIQGSITRVITEDGDTISYDTSSNVVIW